jgi:copper(I)-binding protein
MRPLWIACLALLLGLPSAHAEEHQYKAGDLSIVTPWSQELPPNSPTVAVYFVLRNLGINDDTLTSVDTPIAATAQLHQHVSQDGMMKMQQVQGVIIPANGRAVFAPMNFHVMLLDIKDRSALLAGKTFPVTLHFEKAGDFVVNVEVLKQAPADETQPSHDH